MEQVRTNWLQKAVAIVAGIVLAACLAICFAPAKAWAVLADVDEGFDPGVSIEYKNYLKINVSGLITNGSDVQEYNKSTGGFVSTGAGTEVNVEAENGQLTVCNDDGTKTKIQSYVDGLEAFLDGAGPDATIEGPNFSVKSYYSAIFACTPPQVFGVYQTLDALEQAYDEYLGDGTVATHYDLQVINKYIEVTITGSATVDESSPIYKMISGNDSTWTKGSTTGLVFKTNQDFDEFQGVEIDGVEIEKDKDYTAEAGSIVVTLKPSYLETLDAGPHTIDIYAYNAGPRVAVDVDDTYVAGTFTVKEAGTADDEEAAADETTGTNDTTKSPKTGVETAPLAATTLVFALGALAAGACILRTRKEGVK